MSEDRFTIIIADWRRFDREYAVIDTHHNDRWIIQTNDYRRAMQVCGEMNDEHEG